MKWYADYIEAYTGTIHRWWFGTFEEACAFASNRNDKLPDGNDRVVRINMLGRAAADVVYVNGIRK